MIKKNIFIEIVYAQPKEQKIIKLETSSKTTIIEAIQLSNIMTIFPEIRLSSIKVGIFGKVVAKPESQTVKNGDRVEIYRPLIADLKAIRKKRSEKAKLTKNFNEQTKH